jgi:hypothetical protein
MKHLKVILMLGLVFAYPNLEMLKMKSSLLGDYAIVIIEDKDPWPGTTGQVALYIFEYKYKCVGVFVTPQDVGEPLPTLDVRLLPTLDVNYPKAQGCWELVGKPDDKMQKMFEGLK